MSSRPFCAVAIILILTAGPSLAAEPAADDTVEATIGADGKQHVQIVGGGYFFKPSHVVVKAGVPVELSLSRESGIVPHTFVLKIPESGVQIDESLGTEPKLVEFTPKDAGRYAFYCRNKLLFFKSHRDRGMEGVLEVVP